MPASEVGELAFVDLHCHSAASFDSLSDPLRILRVAATRGLTHVAITDHERIDGAVRARDALAAKVPLDDGNTAHADVIVGEEIRSSDGDVIGLFLTAAIPPGLSGLETVEAIHEQGGLAGIPHPFDRFRYSGFVGRSVDAIEALVAAADYVEVYNARIPFGDANARAAQLAVRLGVPGVAASDAHALMEVGVAYTRVRGDVGTPAALRSALVEAMLVTGRASLVIRALAPAFKAIQRLRGNARGSIRTSSEAES